MQSGRAILWRGGERCLHKQIKCGSTRKEGIRMTSHSPPACVLQFKWSTNRSDDLLAFLCSQSLHSRHYITQSKLTISMTLNDTVTCSKGWRGQTLHWSGTLALICQSAQLVLLGSTARKPLKRPPPKNAPLCWQGKATKYQHSNLLTYHT